MRGRLLCSLLLLGVALSGCTAEGPLSSDETKEDPVAKDSFVPHVLVALTADATLNPYHEVFYRPNLTEHPCTYIKDFPCSVQALDLSVGVHETLQEAAKADAALWDAVRPDIWYWIPKTAFVAVSCEAEATGGLCLLGQEDPWGTRLASSIAIDGPDVLISYRDGLNMAAHRGAGLPVDIFSDSGDTLCMQEMDASEWTPRCSFHVEHTTFHVVAANYGPRPALVHRGKGHPDLISVSGGYTDGSEDATDGDQVDVVSHRCRPTAALGLAGTESVCSVDLTAPTVAAALAQVVLALREHSGYDGSVQDGLVDPELGISLADVRTAMNRTASYAPEPRHEERDRYAVPVPVNPAAPWLQWGWGFYDVRIADATVAVFLEGAKASKPAEAAEYMETMHDLKKRLYG
ncbi:MAG: hypothetical protein KY455_04360 [Euryarchaeota archaeon]|nr:hypothetical protein [Euryarchaeota archaeon]